MIKFALSGVVVMYIIIFACVSSVVVGIYGIMAAVTEQILSMLGLHASTYVAPETPSTVSETEHALGTTSGEKGEAYHGFYYAMWDTYSTHLSRTAEAMFDWVTDSIDIEKYKTSIQNQYNYGAANSTVNSSVRLEICQGQECERDPGDARDLGMTYEDLQYLLLHFERERIPPELFMGEETAERFISEYMLLGKININGVETGVFKVHSVMKRAMAAFDVSVLKNYSFRRDYIKRYLGRMTSKIGRREWPRGSKKYHMHNGTDFSMPIGTAVYAPFDAVVVEVVRNHPVFGDYVIATNGQYTFMMAHLDVSGVDIKPMQFVKGPSLDANGKVVEGTLLGRVSNKGISTGPHLHFEVAANISGTEMAQKGESDWGSIDSCAFITECIPK